MVRALRWRGGTGALALVLALFVGAGAWVLLPATAMQRRPTPSAEPALPPPTGYPQLISVQPLPEMETDREMCQWVPASSLARPIALLQEEKLRVGAGSAANADARTSITLERRPVRAISDPFPTYSAVAVDAKNNEIVLQDENLYQIMVYDRAANTPPTATMTEPKRVIGGTKTKVEFNCSLYIDPKNGDIYSVANDTVRTVSVFSRDAKGNVQPDRQFKTPIRAYGLAVNEAKEELFVTVQAPPAVLVYRKNAQGEEKPIRVLRGNKTGLGDPHGIGLDTDQGWIFVANYGSIADYKDGGGSGVARSRGEMVPGSGRYEPPSITVYPINTGENTPPLRIIRGPNTQLNWPAHIYVDHEHGEVYIANDGADSILVFRETDSGNVAPTRVLKGPKTQIKNPTDVFVDTVNDEMVIANMGNHRATVYRRTAQGDTAPIRTIRAAADGVPALQIANPGSVAYDTKRDEIIVPN